MASDKNVAASHLWGLLREILAAVGYGLGLAAGLLGFVAIEHKAPRRASPRPGPRARKEVGNEHTQSRGQGKVGEGEDRDQGRLLGGTGTRVGVNRNTS